MAIFEKEDIERLIGLPEFERLKELEKVKVQDVEKRKRIEAARESEIAALNKMWTNEKI